MNWSHNDTRSTLNPGDSGVAIVWHDCTTPLSASLISWGDNPLLVCSLLSLTCCGEASSLSHAHGLIDSNLRNASGSASSLYWWQLDLAWSQSEVGLPALSHVIILVSCFFAVSIFGMTLGLSASCIFGHSLLLYTNHSGPFHHIWDSVSSTGLVPLENRSAGFSLVETCCHWAG